MLQPFVKQLLIAPFEHRWALQVAEILFCCNQDTAPSGLKDKLRRNNHGAMELGLEVLLSESFLRSWEICLFETMLL